MAKKVLGEVVDLFCGVGALSHGLKLAGFDVRAGYDIDPQCGFAFERNNNAAYILKDVAKLTASEIRAHFSGDHPTVLAGCAPCQPFSSYKQRYDEDPQWNLVPKFSQLAVAVGPDFITMENVPALTKYRDGEVFEQFLSTLRKGGYKVSWTIANCEQYGVPQKRRRLVVLASRTGAPPLLSATSNAAVSVREAIGSLPAVSAGTEHASDQLHIASSLSQKNLKRIKASIPGGTWRDWPKSLRAECHKRDSGKTYPGVYGRMTWDGPAPTITTQCYGYGNGRFGHPEQDRAITLREAAILQSFPNDYDFLPKGAKVQFTQVGRWIGNAVPVKLAEAIGLAIATSIRGDKIAKRTAPVSV